MKDKLADLCGNWLLHNDFINTFCGIEFAAASAPNKCPWVGSTGRLFSHLSSHLSSQLSSRLSSQFLFTFFLIFLVLGWAARDACSAAPRDRGGVRAPGGGAKRTNSRWHVHLSHRMHLLIRRGKSTPSQNGQLIVYYY